MPCLKMSSDSNSNSNSGGKVFVPTLSLEFVCQTVPPVSDQSAVGGQLNEGDRDREDDEDEDEDEDEETDMVTALRNARAKAIAKAAKQLAIEDGTYVKIARPKEGVNTASKPDPIQAAQPLSYWRADRTLGGSKTGARAGSGSGSGSSMGVGVDPSDSELQLLRCDLAAESVINDGEPSRGDRALVTHLLLIPTRYKGCYEAASTDPTHSMIH